MSFSVTGRIRADAPRRTRAISHGLPAAAPEVLLADGIIGAHTFGAALAFQMRAGRW